MIIRHIRIKDANTLVRTDDITMSFLLQNKDQKIDHERSILNLKPIKNRLTSIEYFLTVHQKHQPSFSQPLPDEACQKHV